MARVDDVIVRLRGDGYPLVKGVVARLGDRRVFVPAERLSDWSDVQLRMAGTKLDLRSFERREGEVLLRADILGHRLIDVAEAELVRAWDVELEPVEQGLQVVCLDTRRPARLLGLLRQGAGHPCRDWKAFEPLIGHRDSAIARRPLGRLGRLKPAQLADLLEDASRAEGAEILQQVHADPELEADVFEELNPDTATRLFEDRSDEDVAGILARMRADDAADALADLPQRRRQALLEAMPAAQRTKVITLMGFNPATAGGVMTTDALTVPVEASVAAALDAVRVGRSLQPEALSTVHAIDGEGRLGGVVPLVRLLQADSGGPLRDVVDPDPVRVAPHADLVDVAVLMADYNLITVPVVDEDCRLLGVITVDDILEATIPEDWRRREPPPRPEPIPPPDSATGT